MCIRPEDEVGNVIVYSDVTSHMAAATLRRFALYGQTYFDIKDKEIIVIGQNDLCDLDGSEAIDLVSGGMKLEKPLAVNANYMSRMLGRIENDTVFIYIESPIKPILILPSEKVLMEEFYILAPVAT